MIPFLIFYYIFSVLFQIGYCDFSTLKGWEKVMGLIIITIVAPTAFPINLGRYIYDNTK